MYTESLNTIKTMNADFSNIMLKSTIITAITRHNNGFLYKKTYFLRGLAFRARILEY